MKKIVTFLFAVLCGISSFAQNNEENTIFRPRATEENIVKSQEVTDDDYKNAVISADKHLAFEGIPINGNLDNFLAQLRRKGFDVPDDDFDNQENILVTFPVDNITKKYVYIEYDTINKNVAEISTSLYIPHEESLEAAVNDVISKLDSAYRFQLNDNSLFTDENGQGFQLCQKIILDDSKQYYLGAVTMALHPAQTGFHLLEVEYQDAYNIRQYNKLIGGVFDLSDFIYKEYFDKCTMEVRANLLRFIMTEKGKTVSFYAKSNDRYNLLKMLSDENENEDFQRFIINSYLYTGIKLRERSQMDVCFQDLFSQAVDLYNNPPENDSSYIAQNNQGNTQPNNALSPKDYFWQEMIGNKIFSEEERKTFQKLGIYPLLMKMIPGVGSMTGGNGPTQWDSYNNAQKGIIHEHDNAR